MSLEVAARLERDVPVVEVSGELDLATAPILQRESGELIDHGYARIAVEMWDVLFMDSTGLRVLLRMQKDLASRDGRLVIIAPSDAVKRVLEISGLRRVFPSYPTLEDAVRREGWSPVRDLQDANQS